MRRPGFGILILVAFTSIPAFGADASSDDTTIDQSVVVTSTRLDDVTVKKSEVPAYVTVIDRARIEASGARTMQDLLSQEAGVVLYDQVGNDVQKTLDLRGFATAQGVAVFIDGARVNDTRSNAIALEQIAPEAIERVEITRGPAAALAGGGAEAGVIRIVTRRGTTPAGALSASAGSFDTQRYDGTYGSKFGAFDFLVSGSYDTSGGFRENAGGDQKRFYAEGGTDLGGKRRLTLSVQSSDLDYGNPGALTQAEFDSDPGQNAFNTLDYTDEVARQGTLNFQGPVGGGFSLATNLAYRTDRMKTLTTGRAAPVFGGFLLDEDGSTWSGTGQATREFASSQGSHLLAFGLELQDGSTDSEGLLTLTSSPGDPDPSSPPSMNTAGARNGGLFVQDAWTINSRISVTAGVRGDRSRVHYEDTSPTAVTAATDTRTFSQVSFRAAGTFHPSTNTDLYLSYADAFLPPTPEQLFAFPGFGSNPDLLPEDAHAYELGTRWHGHPGSLDAAVFWTDTTNEIIFDPTSTPTDLFGRNVNGGRTRRQGVEVSARGHLARSVSGFANATFTKAVFRGGANDGNDVPLVPAIRLSGGIDAALPAGFGIRADALYVGSQTLDNDQANTQPKLDAYTVVNLHLSWTHGPAAGQVARRGRIELFVEAQNLFDETYATRGIYAFDFSAPVPGNAVFLTPAPGRRYFGGATWRL